MSYHLEAQKLGVDPEWLVAHMATVGVGRCPTCWPNSDIIKEGNYIQPCTDHMAGSLESPDDRKVTARPVEIAVSGGYI